MIVVCLFFVLCSFLSENVLIWFYGCCYCSCSWCVVVCVGVLWFVVAVCCLLLRLVELSCCCVAVDMLWWLRC